MENRLSIEFSKITSKIDFNASNEHGDNGFEPFYSHISLDRNILAIFEFKLQMELSCSKFPHSDSSNSNKHTN